jgi:basic membrane lipoprotein Med (substrate-binding protein (PBP1-ABC) superfamily)
MEENMKKLKNIAVMLICVFAVGILGGCASEADMSSYLKALLDTSYKNETQGFVEMKLGTAEEANALYEQGIENGVSAFCERLSISDELKEDYRELYMDILRNVRYSVEDAKKQKDGSYIVNVSYEKMNLFEPAIQLYQDNVAALVNEQANSDENISSEDMVNVVIKEFKSSMESILSKVEYDEPETMTVRIEIKDNVYTPNEDDVRTLEESLVDWE